MSPLDSTAILLGGVGFALRPSLRAGQSRRDPSAIQRGHPQEASGQVAAPSLQQRPRISSISPNLSTATAIIRQAEMLLQITATAASSPALRQIAAAAYQMEIDARREIARLRAEGLAATGRQWFA